MIMFDYIFSLLLLSWEINYVKTPNPNAIIGMFANIDKCVNTDNI